MSTTNMPTTKENIDLMRERAAATISSEEFAVWWAGGRNALQKRRALEERFFNDAQFDDAVHVAHLAHKELTEYSISKGTKFLNELRKWQAKENEIERANGKPAKTDTEAMHDFRMLLTGSLGTGLFQQTFPLRLHFSMFLPTLLNQASTEQQQQWYDKARQMDGIIGTYAQTELGHGSFIRGLETRADYDVTTEEFVLNTPTLMAYKWWPGGLGHTANMVIILAQLYIKNKHYGLYPFLLRIRSAETHEPMPGVDIGEIGPKFGVNGVNNGFLGLHNVRIPRLQMLMKYAKVEPNGKFVKLADPIFTYGTMVLVRVMIVRDVMFGLLQAATIATRYSVIRRQGPIDPNHPETVILEYLTQQAKVLPQIAKGICYRLTADFIWSMYQQVVAVKLDSSSQYSLPELHALSCCLKAICSHDAAEGIDVLRKACGGHGYLSSANFQHIFALATAACTYEGDNTVLLLQTARFLVKQYLNGLKRKVLPRSVTYLRNQSRLMWSMDTATLLRALEISAAEKVRIAFEYQRAKQKETNNLHIGSNLAGIKLTQAAKAHGYAFLARVAAEGMQNLLSKLGPSLANVLNKLLELFIVETFLSNAAAIIMACGLSSMNVEEVAKRYEQLLTDIRPNAVAIVDGFDFHDRVLGSTLGCYDGRVYERLMEEARKSPLNQTAVISTFHSHLKPFMNAKL